MILYICETCHCWQDKSLEFAISQAWAAFTAGLRRGYSTNSDLAAEQPQQEDPTIVSCPHGCGPMTLVPHDARIALLPAAIVDAEQEREKTQQLPGE